MRYEITEKLGEGGMGEVFLAHDRSLDRRVALKLLPEKLAGDEIARKRFLREAKSAAALDHPFICKIYETGEDEGKPFIAMEYVRGETLEQRLARGPLSLSEAVRIASEIAEALETAHMAGLVHRDLKPANIMLTEDGHVKVLDFGLAKRVAPGSVGNRFETASQITAEGFTVGTVAYMSPEQLRGEALDARSDIFSFGLLLYEMTCGTHPFAESSSMDIAAAILNETPTPISGQRKAIPDRLEHLVEKMLAKAPDDRHQLVHEVRTDLARIEELTTPSRPTTPRAGFGIGAIALVSLLIVGVWWLLSSRDVSLPQEGPASVVVLPLRNLSQDPTESDYLAEGISQAVITKLTQTGLRVTPWETARRYGDGSEPAESIARELNVDHVLVGTFQLSGERILTTLSLVEAKSGLQSWAGEFEEPFEDLFQMQRSIAVGAATGLKTELTGAEEEALATPESQSVDAYDLYMQGAHILQEGGEEATNIAFEYFNRAVELDDALADAHVGIGAARSARYYYGWAGQKELEPAEASFERALELSPDSMRARRGLTLLNFYRGRSEASLIQGRNAARVGRADDVETILARAQGYLFGGLMERAVPLYQRVIQLDPANEGAHWHLVIASWPVEPEKAIEVGNTYFRRFGDDPELHMFVAMAHQLSDDADGAREHFEKALALTEGSAATAASSLDAVLFANAGLFFDGVSERDRAEELWRRGIELSLPKLETSPGNVRLRLVLASLYGFLGERTALSTETERALDTSDFFGYEITYLATAHARLGDTAEAVEVLRQAMRQGPIPYWEAVFEMASVPPSTSEAFDRFAEDHRAEVQRLEETY